MLHDGRLLTRWNLHAAAILQTHISHIHHQRVLKAGILLNQEYSPQRLAKESLTLLRDVKRGVSAPLAPSERGSVGARRRRRGRGLQAVLKPTTQLLLPR
jgi:hypothetical protein